MHFEEYIADLLFGPLEGSDWAAKLVLELIATERESHNPGTPWCTSEEGQIMRRISAKIEKALKQYENMDSKTRSKMSKHIKLYRAVYSSASGLTYQVRITRMKRLRVMDKTIKAEEMDEYIKSLVGGLSIMLRWLPMLSDALDKSFQPEQLKEDLLRYKCKRLLIDCGEVEL